MSSREQVISLCKSNPEAAAEVIAWHFKQMEKVEAQNRQLLLANEGLQQELLQTRHQLSMVRVCMEAHQSSIKKVLSEITK